MTSSDHVYPGPQWDAHVPRRIRHEVILLIEPETVDLEGPQMGSSSSMAEQEGKIPAAAIVFQPVAFDRLESLTMIGSP